MTDFTQFEKHLATLRGNVTRDSGFAYHKGLMDLAFQQLIDKHEFHAALDVGIGLGDGLKKFKEKNIPVKGITLNESEQKDAAFMGYDVRVMDMQFLDFPDASFDLVWCRHALEHSFMPIIALMEFYRVLQKGGFLYVEVPSSNNVNTYNSQHLSMFGDEQWQYLFNKAGFKLYFRGQFMMFMQPPGLPEGAGWTDFYWYYWLCKEAA